MRAQPRGRRRLRPGGEVWLTHSSIADEASFLSAIRDAGFSWSVIDRHPIVVETFKLYTLRTAACGSADA